MVSPISSTADPCAFRRDWTLGLSDAMCSRHLKTLADCGYVTLTKRRGETNRHMVTWAAITPQGRAAMTAHLAALRAIAAGDMLDE